MVDWSKVEAQLERIGCNFQFWGRSETRELCHILMEDEKIAHCANGQYQNGFAMLCATDHRVLLIDKKPMNFLNVEDIRFELITEFGYSHRLMNATVRVRTPTKTLTFTSWNQHRLRALINYVQQRVIEIRQHQHLAQQFQKRAVELMEFMQPRPDAPQHPAFVPNLATPSADGTGQQPQATEVDDLAAKLGAYTYAKLPHFRRRNSRNLGQYAIPDAIYPSGRYEEEAAI